MTSAPFAFDAALDVMLFDPAVFGVSEILFTNTLTSGLPTSGVRAKNTAGPGFFVYVNTNLSVARLVFSTDLSDATADLAVLARLTTLSNMEDLGGLTAANFGVVPVPEPGTLLLLATAFAGFTVRRRVQRGRTGASSPALN